MLGAETFSRNERFAMPEGVLFPPQLGDGHTPECRAEHLRTRHEDYQERKGAPPGDWRRIEEEGGVISDVPPGKFRLEPADVSGSLFSLHGPWGVGWAEFGARRGPDCVWYHLPRWV